MEVGGGSGGGERESEYWLAVLLGTAVVRLDLTHQYCLIRFGRNLGMGD